MPVRFCFKEKLTSFADELRRRRLLEHILVPEREGGVEEFEVAPGVELAGAEAVAIGATGRTIEVGVVAMLLAGGATATDVDAGEGALGEVAAAACVSVEATEAGGFAFGWLPMFDNEFGTAGVNAEGPEPQNVTSRLMSSSWQARCVCVSSGLWNAVEQLASAPTIYLIISCQ